MENEIIINADSGETRVALLERSVFTELHIERERSKSVVGHIVKGRVSRVLPGMQAAFVDIGLEKAAFLYVGDYFDNSLGDDGDKAPPGPSRGRNGRRGMAPPRIDTVLSEGQEIVVQIAKAPIGTKGARITSNISIPGRHLVLTPASRRVGVSRRIGSDKERKRLREVVESLRPKDLGFIIRTAGDKARDADLEADIRYLDSIWRSVQTRRAEKPAPCVLHAEHDLPLRIVRDLAGPQTSRIVVDSAEIHEALKTFVSEFVADPKPELEHYQDSLPIFNRFGLEEQIHANLERKVPLRSGGSLVVDQSEALTAIDVNTGRFVGKRDLEETVYKTNLEAVQEVVRQLRFRNIGGLIIIDLIDMESADHREKVYRALQDALRSDKARTNIFKISELGLIEMTRKRTRENLIQTICEPCGHCEGRGYMLSGESVSYNLLREIRSALPRFSGQHIAITVAPRVAERLLGSEHKTLVGLSEELGRKIEIRARPGLHQEQFEVEALDRGPGIATDLGWLKAAEESTSGSENKKPAGRGGKRREGSRRRRGRGGRGDAAEKSRETSPAAKIPDEPEAVEEAQALPAEESPRDKALPALAEAEDSEAKKAGEAGEAGEAEKVERAESAEGDSPEEEPSEAESQPAALSQAAEPGLAGESGYSPAAEPAQEPQPLDDEAESRILPRS